MKVVGKFVDDHVMPVTWPGSAFQHILPRQNDLPGQPRLT